jgi:hypothetical protein
MGAMMERQVLTVTFTVEAHPQYLDEIRDMVEDAITEQVSETFAHLTGFIATKGEVTE